MSGRVPYAVVRVADGTVTEVNDAAVRLLGVDETAVGERVASVFPDSVAATLPGVFADGDPTDRHGFEEYYPELDRWLAVTVVPGDPTTVYADDVTDRVDAEREVESLRAELDRVSLVTELLSDVLVELVDASDRTEVAETICETLGRREAFEFAWLGEREPGSEQLQVRASAGETGDTFAAIREELADTPERAAVERGSARVIEPIAECADVPAPIRQAAFADGVQSAVAVPLTYGDTVYGVVGVYAAGMDRFSERARETFETLGSMAGFAINAARNQNLLFADTITELTFEVTDPTAPLVATAGETGATITVEGTVPQDRDRLVCYLSADESGVGDALAGRDGVETVRVVADHEEHHRLEVVLGEGTPLGTVARLGASVGGATYEPRGSAGTDGSVRDGGTGVGRIRAELPSGEEVRQVADTIRRQFEADTVAKVQRDRSVTTAPQLREELSDALTDRQETALRTAYLAGYFESPRDSTAEEVGEALGITGSTLLHHLRTGQRKLLDAYFETDAEDPTTGFEPL
ncbi:MAG: bacterio-opsin activator domain-containing protein [Halobaculum sp.]